MQAIFTTDGRIGSSVIKAFTASPYHHVGIIDGDLVIEAKMFKGVIYSQIDEYKGRGSYLVVDIPVEDELKAIGFARMQLGKSYDLAGAVGLPFRASWQDQSKWYCSELLAAACAAGGTPIARPEARGFSPRDAWIHPFKVLEQS